MHRCKTPKIKNCLTGSNRALQKNVNSFKQFISGISVSFNILKHFNGLKTEKHEITSVDTDRLSDRDQHLYVILKPLRKQEWSFFTFPLLCSVGGYTALPSTKMKCVFLLKISPYWFESSHLWSCLPSVYKSLISFQHGRNLKPAVCSPPWGQQPHVLPPFLPTQLELEVQNRPGHSALDTLKVIRSA